MTLRTILIGLTGLIVAAIAAALAASLLRPSSPLEEGRPPLAAMPALPPLSGTSTVLTPVAVAIPAIAQALEAQAPRTLTGHPQNPVPQVLQTAELNFTINRGPLNVAGQPDALVVTTPLSGTFQARGTLTGTAGAIGDAIGSILGGNIGAQVQGLGGKTIDQHADIHGTVTATARPAIAPNWRLAPNLTTAVNITDVMLPLAGVKLSVSNEVRPLVESLLRDQTNALETRLRNDPFIENAARAQWAKLCRSIALGSTARNVPDLWLEIRPLRAIAAQPKIDADAVTLLIGVQAQTRIVPQATKPDCPFPAQLDIVPQTDGGTLHIAVPIDIPLAEVSRLVEAQVKGKTFPEDGSGAFATTIKHAAVAASGERLLISLIVNVKKRGLFAFGADATVYVWGKPMLDKKAQILRFTDVALDVQSQATSGLLGGAAQAAVPFLQRTLAEQAIDLKPFIADAKKRMAAAAGEFNTAGNGFTADVAINELQLTGIAYDNQTLRIIADAKGSSSVTISSLSWK